MHRKKRGAKGRWIASALTGLLAALAFGLLHRGDVAADGGAITVRQGRAMGRPSRIEVQFDLAGGAVRGVWLGGPVEAPL